MPAPFSLPEFQSYCGDYAAILESHSRLRTTCYGQAPCYLIPRVATDHITIQKHPDHYRLLSHSTDTANVVPLAGIKTPKQYFELLVEVIRQVGGVTNVPHAYAMALQKVKLNVTKRPWGNQDYVFDTATLATLPGGKFSRIRTYASKLLRSGVSLRRLTPGDTHAAVELENLWAANYPGRFGKAGYLANLIPHLDSVPESMRLYVLGAFDNDRLVGLAAGNALDTQAWACSFRYADNSYHGLSMLLFREIAKVYQDLPWEIDGDAGGQQLVEFKRRLLTDSVLDKQIFMYTVKRK